MVVVVFTLDVNLGMGIRAPTCVFRSAIHTKVLSQPLSYHSLGSKDRLKNTAKD